MHPRAASNSNPAPPAAKPIRFVTNNEGPYAKRRRINSACLTCRRRKTRCSGERPVCMTCAHNKHECGGYGAEGEQASPSESTDSKETVKKTAQAKPPCSRARSPTEVKRQQNHAELSPAQAQMQHTFPVETGLSETHTSRTVEQHSGDKSPEGSDAGLTGQPVLSLSTRNRMPYFRYFGPTAIMPGFKQMVVKVREKQHSTGATSTDPLESPGGNTSSIGQRTPSQHAQDARTPLEIPVYDTSSVAPSPLITHLCKTFFVHLGCNFPFLQEDRFMRDLEEKQVDAILVDAVCAITARFSTNPMISGQSEATHVAGKAADKAALPPSEYGQAFAQRAKSAICDTFACPSVAAVQAALLLAYDEFGASRDSGLWMYLGIAIRMAQDLGMQTLEGLRFEGRNGPTPKSIKASQSARSSEVIPDTSPYASPNAPLDEQAIAELKAVERERLDTFWAVFFLDRVISSGTGRPVTLRDRDIEISFPSLDEVDPATGFPSPFPALIRIIHLYGRVTDLLNRIKEVSQVTPDLIKRLALMETQLTDIYQGLSPKLHFNAINFQHYVKAGHGTIFILLHFWFHTLIVLLHQPTLLKTFEGDIQQLLPNSRELSMSSAKTIADILAFAELIDAKSGIGNPFTSQPIYIAACAFLKETALHSASSNPQSRPSSPSGSRDAHNPVNARLPSDNANHERKGGMALDSEKHSNNTDPKQAARHTLLASAANQNYQRCYRALQSLETYWAGVKYILTVLDQKAKGVGDPLLYTREEMESALEAPRPEPSFTSPGWRRKLAWGSYLTPQDVGDMAPAPVTSALRSKAGSSITSPAPEAIGWSLTGTMNSPSTSLAVLYPTEVRDSKSHIRPQPSSPSHSRSISSVFAQSGHMNDGAHTNRQHSHIKFEPPPTPSIVTATLPHLAVPSSAINTYVSRSSLSSMPPPSTFQHHGPPSTDVASDPMLADADLLLNLQTPSPFANPSPRMSSIGHPQQAAAVQTHQYSPSAAQSLSPSQAHNTFVNPQPQYIYSHGLGAEDVIGFGDMMIESQDIDMSALGDDMMNWIEYLPLPLDPTQGYWDHHLDTNAGTGDGGDASGGAQQ